MKNQKKPSMTGGVVVLLSLVVMLALPMAIGYFTLTPAPQFTLHADAATAEKTPAN